MSANNGIYILHTKDGYRVTHAQAIDNIYWWKTGRISQCKECYFNEETEQWEEKDMPEYERREEINPEELLNYFGHCKVFKTEIEAFHEAIHINKDVEWTEYGIQFIGDGTLEFPTILGEENE